MEKHIRLLSATAAVCGVMLAASVSWAQSSGFYASVLSGANFLDYARTSARSDATTVHGHTSFDTGWLAGISGGYEWPIGLALEEEFTFRTNNLDKISNLSDSAGVVGLRGYEHNYDIMSNVYYRFHNRTPFTPYIGAGIGEAILQLGDVKAPGITAGSFGAIDTEFGYQGIAGVSYRLTERLRLGIEYRYFGTLRPNFEDHVSDLGAVRVHGGYHANDGILRLTYRF